MKNIKCTQLKKRLALDSLRIQLLAITLLVLSVVLILVGLMQYFFMRNIVFESKAINLFSQIESMPPPAWQQPNSNTQDPRPGPHFFKYEASLVFIDLKGNYTVLVNGPQNTTPPKLGKQVYFQKFRAEERRGPRYMVVDAGNAEQLVVLRPVFSAPGKIKGVVQASTPTAPLKELLIRQLITFFIVAIIALLLGVLAYLPVLRRTLIPLSNMVDTAEQIDAGNLDKRFPTQQGQDEIDSLAESFNGMLERLEISFENERDTKEQMRRFVADASHELRTPLTSIHGFLEVLLRGAANQPEQLEKSLQSMHSESKRLNKLVHDLLLLTKLDRTPSSELSEGLLNQVIYDMEPQLHILAGNRELELNIASPVQCRYNSDQMKQVVLNLFQNAVQHTDPDSGRIEICLSYENDSIRLSVQDNGPGISEAHLPHVFERFYRSDSSRTRKYGGSGLGLAISKSIVDAHGGRIGVKSQPGEGCLFEVWLPG